MTNEINDALETPQKTRSLVSSNNQRTQKYGVNRNYLLSCRETSKRRKSEADGKKKRVKAKTRLERAMNRGGRGSGGGRQDPVLAVQNQRVREARG